MVTESNINPSNRKNAAGDCMNDCMQGKTTSPEVLPAEIEPEPLPVEELGCAPCPDWLVVTLRRHTRKFWYQDAQGDHKWGCTLGEMTAERWDTETSGSGPIIFRCKTMERGGPATKHFSRSQNTAQGIKYDYYAQTSYVARENYGLCRRDGNLRTYNYPETYEVYKSKYDAWVAKGNPKGGNPTRPAITVYGNRGPGALDRRTEIKIHFGDSHIGLLGCTLLYYGPERESDENSPIVRKFMQDLANAPDGNYYTGGKYMACNPSMSWDATVEFLDLIKRFHGATLAQNKRIPRIRYRVIEEFQDKSPFEAGEGV